MESNKNNPAYPFQWERNDGATVIENGLTKRELFAAMAMQGILSNPVYAENTRKASTIEILADPEQTVIIKAYSKLAANFADALLEQLNKG